MGLPFSQPLLPKDSWDGGTVPDLHLDPLHRVYVYATFPCPARLCDCLTHPFTRVLISSLLSGNSNMNQ